MDKARLRFWCQKVLPLVYDDSLSYYEVLCKVTGKVNELIEFASDVTDDIKVQVQETLEEWLADGTLHEIVQEAIGDLDLRLTNVEKEIKGFTTNNLVGVKAILIGNSYNKGVGGVGGKGWGYYFTEYTGCDSHIIGQNGGDFVALGNANADYPNKDYTQALTTYANTLTEAEKDDVRLIVVGGGWNDQTTLGSIGNAITSFCNYVKSTFKNAKLWIIPLHSGSKINATAKYIYQQHWCEGASSNGVATNTNTMSWFYGRTGMTNDDGIHLTDAGYKLCGAYMSAVINGWDGDYNRAFGAGWTPATGVVSDGFRYVRKGMIISFTGALKIAENISNSLPFKLGDIGAENAPNTITYFPCFWFNSDLTKRSAGIAYLTPTGALWLANANNPVGANMTIYFGISLSIIP